MSKLLMRWMFLSGLMVTLISMSHSVSAQSYVSHWSAEDNVWDVVGNNDNGFWTDDGRDNYDPVVSYVPGKVGQAFNINWPTWIEVPQDDNLTLSGNTTISLWFRTDRNKTGALLSINDSWQVVLLGDNNQCGFNNPSEPSYGNYLKCVGSVVFRADGTNGSAAVVNSGVHGNKNHYADGQWHHFVGVFDALTGRVSTYVDGQFVATSSQTIPAINPSNSPILIGARYPSPAPFIGDIDEVSILSEALSAAEVADLHAGIITPPVPAPSTSVTIIDDAFTFDSPTLTGYLQGQSFVSHAVTGDVTYTVHDGRVAADGRNGADGRLQYFGGDDFQPDSWKRADMYTTIRSTPGHRYTVKFDAIQWGYPGGHKVNGSAIDGAGVGGTPLGNSGDVEINTSGEFTFTALSKTTTIRLRGIKGYQNDKSDIGIEHLLVIDLDGGTPAPDPAPTLGSVPEGMESLFEDEFDWSAIDVKRWIVKEPFVGAITVGNDVATFVSNGSTGFPYIQNSPPAFPTSGDFIFETAVKYDELAGLGDGVVLRNRATGIFGIWADTNGLRVGLDKTEVPVTGDHLAYHTYRLEYIGGSYSVFVDDVLVLGPTASTILPDNMVIGHPPAPGLPTGNWSDFNIAYVRVSEKPFSPTTVPGLVHLWSGNGDATDAISNADGYTGQSTAFAAGLNGQAFSFDGAQSSRVKIPVDINPSALRNMTVGMFVKLEKVANNRGWVFTNDDGGFDRAVILHDDRFGNGVAAGVGGTYGSTLPTISTGKWHCVAVSFSEDTRETTVFIDGQAQVVRNQKFVSGLRDVFLGGHPSASNHTVAGLIDEVFLFDRALSVAEIEQVCLDLGGPLNGPPVADAGTYKPVEAVSPSGTPVTLDGSASYDDDGDKLTYGWYADGITFDDASSATPTGDFPVGETTVTLTVDDGNGEKSTDEVVISITDGTAPTLTIPGAITAECTGPDGQAISLGDASATDNGDDSPVITNDAPEIFEMGETVVTWTSTDALGNATSGTQLVTIVDTTSPELSVPGGIVAEATGPDGASAELGEASTNDICDPAPVISVEGALSVYPLGTTTVTWTATDASGNVTLGQQTVTIQDTTPPELVISASTTVECEGPNTPVTLEYTVSDIYDQAPVVTNDAPESFPMGTTTVTWTATDGSGNSVTGTQEVVIQDTTEPTLTIPAGVLVEATSSNGTPVNFGEATATDVCDDDVDVSNNAPAVFPLGVTLVTWTATDDSGNSVSDTQEVVVQDTTPPVVSFSLSTSTLWPANHKMVQVASGISASDIADEGPSVVITVTSDEDINGTGDGNTELDWEVMGGDVYLRAERDGSQDGRVYTVMVVATDASGNTTTVTGTVDVPHSQGVASSGSNGKGKGKKLAVVTQSVPPTQLLGEAKVVGGQSSGASVTQGESLTLGGQSSGASVTQGETLTLGGQTSGTSVTQGESVTIVGEGPVVADQLVDLSGNADVAPSVQDRLVQRHTFSLSQNYPNPFNPETVIGYALAEASDVRLIIYNVLGQQVRELVNASQSPGQYSVRWDGRNALGAQVTSGVYIYRLIAGSQVELRKMILLK